MLRAVFWGLVGLVCLAVLLMMFHRGDLSAACSEAGDLRSARLLSASRELYSDVRDADEHETCAKQGLKDVAAAERFRDLALMRARLYRRAAAPQKGQKARGARRRAQFRALRAYITALSRDGHAAGARTAVRKLANAQLGPGSLAGVERRCALGGRLTRAGLLPEANAIYATALRAGKTPARGKGCRHGLRALRIRRAQALRLWRDGRLQERLGHEDAARSRYINALRLDSALAGAAAGRKRVGSRTVHSAAAHTSGVAVTDVSHWLEGAAGWANDRPTTLIGAALLLGGLALLAAAIFFWLISRRPFSGMRRTLTWWPLRRFTETNAEILAIAGGDGMSSVLANVLLLPSAPGGYGIDAQPPSPDVVGSAADEVAAAAPQLAGFAAVLKALRRLVPRRRFTVRGELVPGGPNGLGLAVHIADWRGRLGESRTFWQVDWAPGVTDDGAVKYQLAEAAGWWVRWRLEP